MRRLVSVLMLGLLLMGATLFAQEERPKLYSLVIQGVV